MSESIEQEKREAREKVERLKRGEVNGNEVSRWENSVLTDCELSLLARDGGGPCRSSVEGRTRMQ